MGQKATNQIKSELLCLITFSPYLRAWPLDWFNMLKTQRSKILFLRPLNRFKFCLEGGEGSGGQISKICEWLAS